MSDHETAQARLPTGTRAWVLLSGKIGHEVNCLGVARELGLEPVLRPVNPRPLYQFFAPWGPADPRDSALQGPLPDLVFASGRATAPYLRAIKKASNGKTFTIFLQDPRIGTRAADLIWVPEHDRLRGENVCVTLTSPHHLRPAVLAHARAHPDPRLAHLPARRIGLVLGGPSGNHRFEPRDFMMLAAVAREILLAGHGLMVTPSRRTPPELMEAIQAAVTSARRPGQAFVWTGEGENPYAQILAQAQALIVTGDSANMLGEACATGVPVHVYEPTGRSEKMTGFLDRLVDAGAVRRLPDRRDGDWMDAHWSYEPVDATAQIASTIVQRYSSFLSR